jgi:hypothetical protein
MGTGKCGITHSIRYRAKRKRIPGIPKKEKQKNPGILEPHKLSALQDTGIFEPHIFERPLQPKILEPHIFERLQNL